MENTKSYTLKNLGCPNCAAKMEREVSHIQGIKDASVSYQNKLLRVTAEDPDALVPQMQEICSRIESGVVVQQRNATATKTPPAGDCGCGHDHGEHDHKGENGHGHEKGHDHEETLDGDDAKKDKRNLLISVIAFVVLMIGRYTLTDALPSAAWIVLFGILYIFIAWDVFKEAFNNIREGIRISDLFDENFLMIVASAAAFIIGQYPEGVAVMLFFRIGEFFESVAVAKSRASIMETVDMRPETVTLISDDDVDKQIPAGQAEVGNRVRVSAGERIPLDGTVLAGESRLDTSPVTGEPVPVPVKPGSEILSGSINVNGTLEMRVDKPLSESMVSRILDAVENASANKPKIEKFITRFARIYTPIVCILAVVLAIVPPLLGLGAWSDWISRALSFLVVSCPCALVLSVPLAYFSGIGSGSREGILFKGGNSLEALNSVKVAVFDKTGTLTQGKFAVQEIWTAEGYSKDEILALAAGMEAYSTHPIAESIRSAAKERNLSPVAVTDLDEVAGHGIKAHNEKGTFLCGNARLMETNHVTLPSDIAQDNTLAYLSLDGTYIGSISVADAPKPDAASALQELKAKGLRTVMLTGDKKQAADRVGKQLSVDEVYSELLPDDKLSILRELREKYGPSMFVGDGINDAPVLAGADVGAAMGSGADAAIEAADVVFMNSQVESVPLSFALAKKTQRTAMVNVIFALAVKTLVLVTSVLSISSLWLAVFADVGVSLICVANSMRLLVPGHKRKKAKTEGSNLRKLANS